MAEPMSYSLENGRLAGVQPWKDHYSKRARTPAKKRLALTLAEFEEFGQAYLDHFEAHVKPQVPAQQHTWLDEQVSRALDAYWMPLTSILTQYLAPYKKIFFADETEEIIAENLVALERMINQDLSDLKVLLYFDKSTHVRRYPYTNAIFVGMPYRLVSSDQRLYLQAMPHEVGHYLYWNMGELVAPTKEGQASIPFEVQRSAFREQARAELDGLALHPSVLEVLFNWLEEMFADVIGAHLGEGRYFDSTVRLIELMARTSDDLLKNDGRHPILLLRPYVVARTLEHIGKPLPGPWSAFASRFGLQNLDDLEMQVPLTPYIERRDDESEKEFGTRVLKLFVGQETDLLPVRIRTLRLGLDRVVTFINQQIDAYREGQPATFRVRDLERSLQSPLEQLIQLAERRKDEAEDDKALYEYLLEPQALEGGYVTHTHGAQTTWDERDCHPLWTYHEADKLGSHTHYY